MCTLTLFATHQGYLLGMNRDEQRNRPIALNVHEGKTHKGLDVIYPIDPQGGGTWLGVNKNGLSLALLNQSPIGYQKPKIDLNSRGIIIPKLILCESAEIALQKLSMLELKYFAPFQIVAIDSTQVAYSAKWDGKKIEAYTHHKLPFLAASSSWNEIEVQKYRHAKFLEFTKGISEITPEHLKCFHQQKEIELEAFSVNMSREDAQSVSYNQIEFNQNRLIFSYYLASSDCKNHFTLSHSAELKVQPTRNHRIQA
ncbi:MAG: NRDE family protein [Bdellovibrionota bacterium]